MAPQSFEDFVRLQQQAQSKKSFGYQNAGVPMTDAKAQNNYRNGSPGIAGSRGGKNPYSNGFFPSQYSNYTPDESAESAVTSGASSLNTSSTNLALLSISKLNLTDSPIQEEVITLERSSSIEEINNAATKLVEKVSQSPDTVFEEWGIYDIMKALIKPKNPSLVREASMVLVQKFAQHPIQGTSRERKLISFFSLCYDEFVDKDVNCVRAAKTALDVLYRVFPEEALGSVVLDENLRYLASSARWNSKLACLNTFDRLVDDVSADILEMSFIKAIPVLTDLTTDFKPEIAKHGMKTMKKFVKVLDNLDLENKYDLITETLSHPQMVPECIKNLSSVTFVAEVTEPALSLLVPILEKSLKLSSSSNEQLRRTVMVAENLTRLVNNKREIEPFIPVLMPGVEKVVNNASVPEVRELAQKALDVLEEAAREQTDGKFHGRISIDQAKSFFSEGIDELLKDVCKNCDINDYVATIVQVDANVNDWKRLLGYLNCFIRYEDEGLKQEFIEKFVGNLRDLFSSNKDVVNSDSDGIEIVNTDFSLAYGTRMLLNKTNLRLLKGHRYGLCGRNGTGKSTLMRAISKGQLEGFPSADELKTCFVEHNIQASEADLDIVTFIASDSQLQSTSKEDIAKALKVVGFTNDLLSQSVGSLSGGWKMKLELARAMLMKADILLLDEPTNHLDTRNVKWLQDYLIENTNITSLIVSHDSSFLDAVCTDIIHYENKKLAYYRGNLSEFVNIKPEAKSYYTLTDANFKMCFPPPGILSGVKSNTRAVARMSDVSYTYSGSLKPSLKHISCSLSLSSRVAVLGPNGAGKSTLIKLLTGELVPTEGKVEKHPNLRIGYIAQHALQHVEEHKEKTANQYLQWRYRFGEDREVMLKESRKISEDEKDQMSKKIDVGDGREPREIEAIVGRQKLKKSFQYELTWKYWPAKFNSWVSKEFLIEQGFEKLVQKFDDHEASREGLGYRELTPPVIREHLEGVGLDGEIADHTPLGSLSGGQLVKVVIAGAMWNNPHLLVLDEPTNYLDRDSLGGLASAIRNWSGGVVMISHHNEFVGALCPEQWIVENGELKEKHNFSKDSSESQPENPKILAKKTAEDNDSPANIKVKTRKKKMTRNEKKLQAERRRLRHIEWLSSPKGTPKPPDTDEESD